MKTDQWSNDDEKQELEARIAKTEYSTYISEAQEYSIKKQSVSLSQTRIIDSNLLQRPENKT